MPNDQYQLGELLGRGGMGQVHVARHRSGRLVAVKRVRDTLSLDRLVVERLADEARLLRSVSHPNVVRALDDGTDSAGRPFLVMDRAHGTPLNQLIAQHGGLPRERVVAIASQLFAGLAAIHDAQIVHADLKSHNVLVDEVDIVTIIDFGLARALTDAGADSDLIAGTPAYMAPEMLAGAQPSVAADIYAMATILYEMLTGSTPFTGHISTILTRQLSEPAEAPSQRAPERGITPALDRVIMCGLDPSPDARYASVREFAAAFSAALAGAQPSAVLARGSAMRINLPTLRDHRRQLPRSSDAPHDRAGSRPGWRVRRPGDTALDEARSRSVGSLDATVRLVRASSLPPRVRKPGESTTGSRGDPGAAPPDVRTEVVISQALDDAQRRIAQHQLAEAIDGLETTLASLAPGFDSDEPISASVWRIQTVLAALYESLGMVDHARRMALVGYRHAARTGCPLAEARARALVDRLVVRTRRLARGSSAGIASDEIPVTGRPRRPVSDGNR